ncbi:peptidase M20 [Sporanaerobium hydrogeniformans]|uniref:Peptidase M20 n=1 Tax=Sporanaerobium hydrogeniformans TaxID=3072179 RepID=A0AC61DAC6_9FIRM|nr:amidohydrolase [Sporanaerobium hydrogeniformans]PHV69713.1 peptidase M20 [Sporanaerobium hydrogeniformans]
MEPKVKQIFDEIIKKTIELAEDIYRHPELGYKEIRTAGKVKEILEAEGIAYEDQVAYTGILSTLDSKKSGPHIGLICELDAVPTLNHPYANQEDYAAHTCGHYAQIGVMLSVFLSLHKAHILGELCGKVTLVVTPAEEFCDLEYRRGLIAEGKIKHVSGKQEMIERGVFDDMSLILSCHTMGLDMSVYDAEIGASLNGFLCKKAIFHGRGAHAGSNPAGGINALNAANLAMSGIHFLRETFREEDAIRVHFVVTEGGQTVNTVPERVTMEMYVRAKTVEAILETDQKVTRALRAGALAIGCDLEIIDTPGYLPLHQDENLTALVKEHILTYIAPERIAQGTHGFASGDMGDLSSLYPIVEIGIGGFTGTMHGSDFKTANYEQAYHVPAAYFIDTIVDLLRDDGKRAYEIKEKFKPIMSKEAYLAMLDRFNKTTIYKKGE